MSQGEHRADRKVWQGSPPESCDICKKAITVAFVDGRTSMGPWANMCLRCYATHGTGLGTGCGQQYERDNRPIGPDLPESFVVEWVKVRG